MGEQNLWAIFSAVAQACPERDAIIWRDRSITYAELADQATRLANLLTQAGLGPHRARDELKRWESGQDLVALYLLNGPEYLVATLAGYASRAAPFNVNYRYVPAELAGLFTEAPPAAVIYHQRYAPALRAALRGTDLRPVLIQVPDGSGQEPAEGALDYHAAVGAQPGVLAARGPDRAGRLAPGHDGIGWLAKSGHIPLGYLNDPARTARTFPLIDGVRWSVPGDRARLLADGTVELLGRDAQTINSLGEKIFAEEVEQAIAAHPAVRDVVVVGRPSPRWGEEVVAVVALRPGASVTDAEIIGSAAGILARYKLPKAIIRVPAVQRSPVGKASYRWAIELAAAHAPGLNPGSAGA